LNLADARLAFRELRTAHVGTVLPDGTPHVVPLWFVWLEDAVFVTCRRASRVWRNVERDPHVALQFDRGRRWAELAGVLVRGRAECLLPDDPASRRPLSAWFDKYRSELGGASFASYAEQVPNPGILKVRPERLAGWIHTRS
jgi:PPOX class probable F420-dependent enzyme